MPRYAALALLTILFGSFSAVAADPVSVAITTSTRDTGLFDALSPAFTKATGIPIRVIAAGTGQAIRIAQGGDVDVLFVHHKPSEEKFVANGYGVKRYDVMSNTFVLVGPGDDPVGIKGETNASKALAKIAAAEFPFLSRGDESGTHKKEKSLWTTPPSGSWYRQTGQGQGVTLNMAVALGGYALTDKGTWLSYRNKADFGILLEGDSRLTNPYGVILVNPEKYPHVNAAGGQAFIEWLTGPAGQSVIQSYTIKGQMLFTPAHPPVTR